MKVRMRICFFCVSILLVVSGVLCVYLFWNNRNLNEKNMALESITAQSQEMKESEEKKEVQSKEELTVQESAAIANGYYAVIEDGVLVVYRGDKKTLYLKTDVMQEEISKRNREELKTGVLLESQKELYDYLESCTS